MKITKLYFLLVLTCLGDMIMLQGMMGRYLSPARFRSFRNISQASVKMPINEPLINIPAQESSGMQRRFYSSDGSIPQQKSLWNRMVSFFRPTQELSDEQKRDQEILKKSRRNLEETSKHYEMIWREEKLNRIKRAAYIKGLTDEQILKLTPEQEWDRTVNKSYYENKAKEKEETEMKERNRE